MGSVWLYTERWNVFDVKNKNKLVIIISLVSEKHSIQVQFICSRYDMG